MRQASGPVRTSQLCLAATLNQVHVIILLMRDQKLTEARRSPKAAQLGAKLRTNAGISDFGVCHTMTYFVVVFFFFPFLMHSLFLACRHSLSAWVLTGPFPMCSRSWASLVVLPFLLCFSVFLGPHLWQLEVPRLGLNQTCSCRPTPQPQQRRI